MDKLNTQTEYVEWAKTNLNVDFEHFQYRTLYQFNLQSALENIQSHPFLKELDTQLTRWAEEYKTHTESDLLMQHSGLKLLLKPYDSAVNKSFRINVLSNQRFPDEPEEGWVNPDNLPEYLNDSIRGTLVCKFIDGPKYLTAKLTDYADTLGLSKRWYSRERDDGYYAYHFYTEFNVPLTNAAGETREAEIDLEIQITTQIQEALRSLTHRFYEESRIQPVGDSSKWKWDYTSNRFRVGYLSHALHLLEAVIVQSRDDGRSTLVEGPDMDYGG